VLVRNRETGREYRISRGPLRGKIKFSQEKRRVSPEEKTYCTARVRIPSDQLPVGFGGRLGECPRRGGASGLH